MSALLCALCDSDDIVPCAGGPPEHAHARCRSCGAECSQQGPEPRDVVWTKKEAEEPRVGAKEE